MQRLSLDSLTKSTNLTVLHDLLIQKFYIWNNIKDLTKLAEHCINCPIIVTLVSTNGGEIE